MKLALATLTILFFCVAVWALGALSDLEVPVVSSAFLK
jgi:hypothetical protein